MFTAVLFIIVKTCKQPECSSTDEWKNRCGICTQWDITQPLKKNKIVPFVARWKDLDMIILSKVNQKEKTNSRRYNLYVETEI